MAATDTPEPIVPPTIVDPDPDDADADADHSRA